jgi:hypothetical protein
MLVEVSGPVRMKRFAGVECILCSNQTHQRVRCSRMITYYLRINNLLRTVSVVRYSRLLPITSAVFFIVMDRLRDVVPELTSEQRVCV